NFEKAKLTKASPTSVLTFGPIELKNETLGTLKCENIIAGTVWNESEKGVAGAPVVGHGETQGYITFNCTSGPTKCSVLNGGIGEAFAVAETPLVVTEKGTEKLIIRHTTMPWTGELIETEVSGSTKTEKQTRLHSEKVYVTIVCPGVFEIPFKD